MEKMTAKKQPTGRKPTTPRKQDKKKTMLYDKMPDETFNNRLRNVIVMDETFVPIVNDNKPGTYTIESLLKDVRATIKAFDSKTDVPTPSVTVLSDNKNNDQDDARNAVDYSELEGIPESSTPWRLLHPMLQMRHGSRSTRAIETVLKQTVIKEDEHIPRGKAENSKDKAEWLRTCAYMEKKKDRYITGLQISKRRYRGSMLAALGSLACATAVTQVERQIVENGLRPSEVLAPENLNDLERMFYRAMLINDVNTGIVNKEDKVSPFVMVLACTYAKTYFTIEDVYIHKEIILSENGGVIEERTDESKKKPHTIKHVKWTLNKAGKARLRNVYRDENKRLASMLQVKSHELYSQLTKMGGSMLDFASSALSLGLLGVLPTVMTELKKTPLDKVLNKQEPDDEEEGDESVQEEEEEGKPDEEEEDDELVQEEDDEQDEEIEEVQRKKKRTSTDDESEEDEPTPKRSREEDDLPPGFLE